MLHLSQELPQIFSDVALTICSLLISVSGIAPDAAKKMKTVSRQFSFLKKDLKAARVKDADFNTLSNFPFFVNVNIQISHEMDCKDEIAAPSNLRRGEVLMTCIEVSVGLEVMMAQRHAEVDKSSGKRDVASESNKKFLSLIRNKQLAEHHNKDDLTLVQADTDAGFYDFTVTRHESIIADLECTAHYLARQACVAPPGGQGAAMHCSLDASTNTGNPEIKLWNRAEDMLRVSQPSLAQPALSLKTRIVVYPR